MPIASSTKPIVSSSSRPARPIERRGAARVGAPRRLRRATRSRAHRRSTSGGRLSSGDRADMVVFQIDANDLVETRLGGEAERRARAASNRLGQPATMRSIDSSGWRRISLTAASPATAAQRLDLLADRRRDAGHRQVAPRAELGEVDRRRVDEEARPPSAARRANGARFRRPAGSPRVPPSGSRMMPEKKPEAALLGGPGRTHDRRQPHADPVEKAAPRIVGEQQFADRLLRAVARQRRREEFVADRFGERRAEHRDRRGEDEPRPIGAAGAPCSRRIASNIMRVPSRLIA